MSHISLPEKYHFVSTDLHVGTVVIEPFFPGYATTIGNAFRRILLSSLSGSAITAFSVRGVPHEFSTLPGVKEDFIDISLNLKQVAVRVAEYVLPEGMQLSVSAKGERTVTAGDFTPVSGVEILNPDQVIATLTNEKATLELEVFLARGYRAQLLESAQGEKTIGRITIDSWYSPVRDVAISVENIRVGQMTNYERLKITIKTNGTLTPEESFRSAVAILLEQYRAIEHLALNSIGSDAPSSADVLPSTISSEEELSPVTGDREDEVFEGGRSDTTSPVLVSGEEEKPKGKKRKLKKEV